MGTGDNGETSVFDKKTKKNNLGNPGGSAAGRHYLFLFLFQGQDH